MRFIVPLASYLERGYELQLAPERRVGGPCFDCTSWKFAQHQRRRSANRYNNIFQAQETLPSRDRLLLVEGETQASLHRTAAVLAVGDAAAEPLPLGSVQAGVAVVDPLAQVPGHGGPVEVLDDLPLANPLAVVALVVVELLQDGVDLGTTQALSWSGQRLCPRSGSASFEGSLLCL